MNRIGQFYHDSFILSNFIKYVSIIKCRDIQQKVFVRIKNILQTTKKKDPTINNTLRVEKRNCDIKVEDDNREIMSNG